MSTFFFIKTELQRVSHQVPYALVAGTLNMFYLQNQTRIHWVPRPTGKALKAHNLLCRYHGAHPHNILVGEYALSSNAGNSSAGTWGAEEEGIS